MSIGRLPGLMLAVIVMGALSLLLVWTRMSEIRVRATLRQEIAYVVEVGGHIGRLEPIIEVRRGGPRIAETYFWRLRLMELRRRLVGQMLWVRRDARLGVPPAGWLLLVAVAEALRRRRMKRSALISFPNEVLFHLGLWLGALGSLAVLVGYLLSPVAVPPCLALLGFVAVAGGGLVAVISHIPGRLVHGS